MKNLKTFLDFAQAQQEGRKLTSAEAANFKNLLKAQTNNNNDNLSKAKDDFVKLKAKVDVDACNLMRDAIKKVAALYVDNGLIQDPKKKYISISYKELASKKTSRNDIKITLSTKPTNKELKAREALKIAKNKKQAPIIETVTK